MLTDWTPLFTGNVSGSNGEGWFISDGLSRGQAWATYRRKSNGALQRVTSPYLPPRLSRFEAERDLAVFFCMRFGAPEMVSTLIDALVRRISGAG